jgi:hypothetical protein
MVKSLPEAGQKGTPTIRNFLTANRGLSRQRIDEDMPIMDA